jgi:Fe-S-cluster containining protein
VARKKLRHSPPCTECPASCCRHIAHEIDTPTCKGDYDNIRWFLLHQNVKVFVDHDNVWHLEFITPCKKLDENNRCTIYPVRPRVCRDYPGTGNKCEFETDESPYKMVFTEAEQFEGWLAKRKKRWRWAWHSDSDETGSNSIGQ